MHLRVFRPGSAYIIIVCTQAYRNNNLYVHGVRYVYTMQYKGGLLNYNDDEK